MSLISLRYTVCLFILKRYNKMQLGMFSDEMCVFDLCLCCSLFIYLRKACKAVSVVNHLEYKSYIITRSHFSLEHDFFYTVKAEQLLLLSPHQAH